MSDLAKALVIDYDDWGLAEKVSETSLRSLDGDTVVDLQPALAEDGETVGLQIFVNDVHVESLPYTDDNFSEKLVKVLAEPLNF
jgi:hypothetical protein